jgi:basic membrane protein A
LGTVFTVTIHRKEKMMKMRLIASLALLAGMILAISGGVAAQTANTQAATAQVVSRDEALEQIYLPLIFQNYTQFKVGLVTDQGGVDDKTFNALAWKGITDAVARLGVDGKYLESSQQSDYATNIQLFLNENEDLIVTVGFSMGIDTATAAKANPGAKFAIVDYTYPDCWQGAIEGVDCGSATDLPNVRGMTFQTDQAAVLAGYLAAGMTKTGKVATFGGMQIPVVTIFMKGYQAGVKYYNKIHSASVQELGWDDATQAGLFTGSFSSTEAGRAAAETLVQQGADIILPVAGPCGLGAANYCQDNANCLVIGVDSDWFFTAPQYSSIILTSLQKKIDVAVFTTIQDVVDDTFSGGTVTYSLANDGVGLAPFHDFDSQVPQALKDELAQMKADLISGVLTVDGILSE